MELDALVLLVALGSIGPTILKTAVATNSRDANVMMSLGVRVFQYNDPSSAENRCEVLPEEGSTEEEVLNALDINNTLAFNALFDQLHLRNQRLVDGYDSLVDYNSDEESESSYPVEGMLV